MAHWSIAKPFGITTVVALRLSPRHRHLSTNATARRALRLLTMRKPTKPPLPPLPLHLRPSFPVPTTSGNNGPAISSTARGEDERRKPITSTTASPSKRLAPARWGRLCLFPQGLHQQLHCLWPPFAPHQPAGALLCGVWGHRGSVPGVRRNVRQERNHLGDHGLGLLRWVLLSWHVTFVSSRAYSVLEHRMERWNVVWFNLFIQGHKCPRNFFFYEKQFGNARNGENDFNECPLLVSSIWSNPILTMTL